MAEKNEKKTINKNYIIFILILLVTATVVIYVINWYKAYKENDLNTPLLGKYLKEVKYNELDTYLSENPNAIIYIGLSNDKISRDFEIEFIKTIKKYNLEDIMVYLNAKEMIDQGLSYEQVLDSKYNTDALRNAGKTLDNAPMIVLFNSSMAYDVMNSKEHTIEPNNVIQLLEEYEIIDGAE